MLWWFFIDEFRLDNFFIFEWMLWAIVLLVFLFFYDVPLDKLNSSIRLLTDLRLRKCYTFSNIYSLYWLIFLLYLTFLLNERILNDLLTIVLGSSLSLGWILKIGWRLIFTKLVLDVLIYSLWSYYATIFFMLNPERR